MLKKNISKPFWSTCQPYFSKKYAKDDADILLLKTSKTLLNPCKSQMFICIQKIDFILHFVRYCTFKAEQFEWLGAFTSKHLSKVRNFSPTLIKVFICVKNQGNQFMRYFPFENSTISLVIQACLITPIKNVTTILQKTLMFIVM